MIYAYACPKCAFRFDVVKPHTQMRDPESCRQCGAESVREFAPQRVHFIGASVQHAEYNPGLGCVVRNKQHRAELARSRGLEEVGSEPVEKLHKKHDTERAESLDRKYDDLTKGGWVGDGS